MTHESEIRTLIQTTLRTFYEAKYTIVMDQLVRKEAMRDEELAARIGLTTKDVYKLSNKLSEEGFLATHRRNEVKPGAMKATARTWYYIDYQRTIDNIKWRMYKIRKVIDDKLRNELDQQGYVCPRCKTRFTTLDAGALLDFATNSMRCDRCGTDVVDNENIDDVKRSKDQMSRLLAQTKLIVDGLRKTESAPLAKFDIAAWLDKHHPLPKDGELPIPTTSGPAKVTIELVDGDEESEAKKRQAAEAEAKRVQNALPSWIERSTITGELTAAGAAQNPASKPGGIVIENDGVTKDGTPSPKKTANSATDDVDAYYAALAAAQAAYAKAGQASASTSTASAEKEPSYDDSASTQQGSPSSGSAGHSKLVDSGYEEFGDDAFSTVSPASNAVSPGYPASISGLPAKSISHLPNLRPPSALSTQSLGKRSREPSEDGSQDGKKARTEETTPIEPLSPASAAALVDIEENGEENGEVGDDPILTVNGKEMPYSSITEDMTAEMTPEEYQLWWETMAAVG